MGNLRIYLLVLAGALSSFAAPAQRVYATSSVLGNGNWYQFAVTQAGVYRIDVAFLGKLGVISTGITSSSIRVFGNGGGMLPENNAIPRIDDLAEIPLEVFDGGDGIFNNNDYLVFYAPGPQRWLKDSAHQAFAHQKNLFCDSSFYYISIGGTGLRIATAATPVPNRVVNSFNEHIFYENDLVNLLNSGKDWYGEKFSNATGNISSRNFLTDFTGLLPNTPLTLTSSLAAASIGTPASFSLQVNGQPVQTVSLPAITGNFLDPVATSAVQNASLTPTSASLSLAIGFSSAAQGAQGWLDWFEWQGRKLLSMSGLTQLAFRDWASVGSQSIPQFSIANTPAGTEVWEVTDLLHPVKMPVTSGTQTLFNNDASRLREYIAFSNTTGLLTPLPLGRIPNQDLHHPAAASLLIITHPSFLQQAQRLATFHAQHDGLTSAVVTTPQVYNEFSSGTPDPSALRDFVKMFYDRAAGDSTKQPKYLLLLGAASFDYQARIANNTNLLPCYESAASLDPLLTHTSDDFFALLGDSDDVNSVSPAGLLDIGVGRLPARSASEAQTMVNKVIRYSNAAGLGAWRNQSVYVADDKDNDVHVQDAEAISKDAQQTNPLFNQTKIYLDAYPLVSGSGGGRYPAVNSAIVNQVSSGILFFNYNGHGGYQRLADEAILGQDELNQFHNPDKLPLFITATCDFAPYDDPTKNSIGGSLLYGDSTGAIALMTTTRDVFTFSNHIINDNYLQVALQPDANGKYLTLGDAVKRAKNLTYQTYSDVFNNRKFTLLGDPALRLAFPQSRMQLTSINGHPVTGNDTLKALQKYVFAGTVTDAGGNLLTQFNGSVYPIVFDQPQQVSTLGNDPASPVMSFSQQTNVLYKGKTTVQNGVFSFQFIVPKDISFQAGHGRLSLYADNGAGDANGVSASFYTGGGGNAVSSDRAGPLIRPYINDTSFADGGITDENPVFIAELFDTSGINTSGTGIGHDITAVIDGNQKDVVVLNAYYTAALDSYQRGEVRYQLPPMSEGDHTVQIKAWDVADNSGEAIVHFRVVEKGRLQVTRLFNYPNPFTTTTIFSFEHNQTGENLQVTLSVYGMNGQLVYQLAQPVTDAGNRSIQLQWNGKSMYGEKLSRGMYIYRVNVSGRNGMDQASGKLMLF